jgi:hypothetical protein
LKVLWVPHPLKPQPATSTIALYVSLINGRHAVAKTHHRLAALELGKLTVMVMVAIGLVAWMLLVVTRGTITPV